MQLKRIYRNLWSGCTRRGWASCLGGERIIATVLLLQCLLATRYPASSAVETSCMPSILRLGLRRIAAKVHCGGRKPSEGRNQRVLGRVILLVDWLTNLHGKRVSSMQSLGKHQSSICISHGSETS